MALPWASNWAWNFLNCEFWAAARRWAAVRDAACWTRLDLAFSCAACCWAVTRVSSLEFKASTWPRVSLSIPANLVFSDDRRLFTECSCTKAIIASTKMIRQPEAIPIQRIRGGVDDDSESS